MPDDSVLLLLDGRRDRLHLVAALPGERADEEGIFDGDLCVEKSVKMVFRQLKLTAQQKVNIDPVPVHSVEGLPVVLVVIGLGNGGAPVDHQRFMGVFGNTGAADVVLLGILVGIKLQLYFGKIGSPQKPLDMAELLGSGIAVDIVLIDGMVHDLEFDVGLHRIRVPVEIERQIFTDIQLLRCGFFRNGADPALQTLFHRFQFIVNLSQVLLLQSKYVSHVLQRLLLLHSFPICRPKRAECEYITASAFQAASLPACRIASNPKPQHFEKL